jgi:hypothetical protein
MGKQASVHSFTSILAKRVLATQSMAESVQPLYPELQKVNIVLEEEDECEPSLLASKIVFN